MSTRPFTSARPGFIALLCATALVPVALAPAAQAQSVSISPGYTNIGVNQQLQYSATVTGLANTAVTWAVYGGPNATPAMVGTITQTGLYTAPATVPTVGIVIEAIASDKKTVGAVYVNVAAAGPSITSVSPNPVPNGNFTVTITGSGFQQGAQVNAAGVNLGVTYVNSTTLKATGWQGPVGTFPFKVMNPGTLWGTPLNVPFVQSGPPQPQSIAPTSVTVTLGTTQQFTSANATNWTTTAGSITQAGLFTAPATIPASGIATVTASGPGGSASATVTLVSSTPQTIAPTSVSLNLGATQQFTSAGATTWSATYGTITSAGLYTAPANVPASLTDTVKAIGPNGTATATVNIILPTPVITNLSVNGNVTTAIPLGSFKMTITGTGFTNKSAVLLGNTTASLTSATPTTLTVSGFASVSGNVALVVSNGAVASAPFMVTVGVPNAQVSAAAARRFLEQAAFGPTPSDAAHVQQVGFQGWLSEQFTMPQVSDYSRLAGTTQGRLVTAFLTNAVNNPDQLRQRVAFAYSQLFVTSISKLIFNDRVIPYQTMLLADAFKNYRQILSDVTLSGAMGYYLDMGNNAKANPATGSVANENYAREVLQLFSIGTKMLNQDGTVATDAVGFPIPTYSQFTVTEFARVFTGWTYAPTTGPLYFGSYVNAGAPMQSVAAFHDNGSKQLLNGAMVPAGLTPQADLDAALDNIFNHPNVGPFVGRNLIQHLVKSNPSPAYIQRVAAAFNNNGQGVRGDMQAVITAILLDPEARANDNGGNDQVTDGHLTEPLLFIPGVYRAMAGTMADTNYYGYDLVNLNQDVYNSPSVFNYFSPFFRAPGTTLFGPEFQIDTPNNAVYRANMTWNMVYGYQANIICNGPGSCIDETPFLALAPTPATLVDALDLTFTHGTMPPALKSLVVAAAQADTNGIYSRVQTAMFAILSSSYYNVWH
jgi:uncharacterized protein (DUF1800 family)